MSKEKQSKLDPYAERLEEWFTPVSQGGKGFTLAQAQEQLRLDGCSVSPSRLSDWWQARLKQKQEAAFFADIATGGRMLKELDQAYARNPEPGIDQLIRMVKTLILQLQLKGQAEPKSLVLANSMLKTVLTFLSGRTKATNEKEKIGLSRDKFEFDAAKACLKALPALKAISMAKGLSDDQRVEQIRLKLFGVLAEESPQENTKDTKSA